MATDFFMITPMDTTYANVRTDVRMTYDDEHLYILVVNYKAHDGPNVVASLRRDFVFGRNDNFIFFMDPFDDLTNGFSFGANAAGAQWDGMMFDGGRVNLNWDTKWVSQVRDYHDRWIFEAAIPFKSIRYNEEITRWGINFSRKELTVIEKSGWAPVPRQLPSASLAYTGNLVWDAPPPSAGTNISVIPHVVGGLNHDFEHGQGRSWRRDAGLTAKIGLSSSLNLDLTINPDFSQVEVDEQMIDFDRYELFFPEKRQFFLENEDIFASFGNPTIRPFFSRRIGLDTPILFGGRLSGQLNRDWRIGAMNMQTDRVSGDFLPSRNYTVLSLRRRVSDRSNLGFMVVNNTETGSLDGQAPAAGVSPMAWNRNIGAEYNLASANDLWNGNIMLLGSFSPDHSGRTLAHTASLRFADGNWLLRWAHDYVGEQFTAETGYVPRRGYVRLYPEVGYLFYPSGGRVLSHGPLVRFSGYQDETLSGTDHEHRFVYRVNFRKGTRVQSWVGTTYIELLRPFDPTNVHGARLAEGSTHRWSSTGISWDSPVRRLFTWSLSGQYGGYYADGSRLLLSGEAGYRFQPYVNIVAAVSYNRLDLPEPWGLNGFWLTGTRVDVTFTNNLYFTTFTQYNEQMDNININSRLQWRFKPASDLFLVYTDNYLPGVMEVRNRALLLKLTYWWNL